MKKNCKNIGTDKVTVKNDCAKSDDIVIADANINDGECAYNKDCLPVNLDCSADDISDGNSDNNDSSSIIEFKNVMKTYKMGDVEINALNGVDFTIEEGEFVIVLGTSGAGKSTILNILGGMDTATSGEVLIEGTDITNYNSKELTLYRRHKVGFVFQFYNLISNLTALENVEFAASVTTDFLDPKETLAAVGLAEREKNFPSQLSGGEQQRVAIARAVAKNPILLLCDEPTGALDYKTGKMVLQLLQDLNRDSKKTILLITHNSMIAPMADKVINVKSGKIESVIINKTKSLIEDIEW